MAVINLGKIIKINGYKVCCSIYDNNALKDISINNFNLNYISIGALVGTRLVDGRILVLLIEDIYDLDGKYYFNAVINGIYDEVLDEYSFGTNSYPLINEMVFKLDKTILNHIFCIDRCHAGDAEIGSYFYDNDVLIKYNPNVLFGKHLGVFGNTGSGKTCTVVSLIQNYIRKNFEKDIKFIILDVNGEYKEAFDETEYKFYGFNHLRFNHHILNNSEYGKLFRAAEGIQFPALKECIRELSSTDSNWSLQSLYKTLEEWIDRETPLDNKNQKDRFSKNTITGHLRTMMYRIEQILAESDLCNIIDNSDDISTLEEIFEQDEKVAILDLQTSNDTLDIVLYLLFKSLYDSKINNKTKTHICLVLEEAHRYINTNIQETKLGTYYIDKLAREGRKFGVGLIISSQVPSMLSYEIVSQCNSTVMHKITNKRDMEYLKSVLRISNDSFFMQMSSLEKQYAIVSGEAFSSDTIVKILDASPLPKSNDPIIQDRLL